MAVLNIEIGNLSNGQELILPFDVTATVSAPAGAPANLSLSAAARQIDDQALVSLTVPPVPMGGSNLPAPLMFGLSSTDCPDVNTWYMLTVYAWDSGGDCTMQSLSFKRISDPNAVPPPPCPNP